MSYFVAAIVLWAAVWLWHPPSLTLRGAGVFVLGIAPALGMGLSGYGFAAMFLLIIGSACPFFFHQPLAHEMRYYSGGMGYCMAAALSAVSLIQGQIPAWLNLLLFWTLVMISFAALYFNGRRARRS
ncbi:MAG: hypothetical protein KDE51_22090, partial [Anaerolineales bacterium]|nr:hypothetical protein [Anaerolineales bacterium]